MPLIDRLRQATSPVHRQLEQTVSRRFSFSTLEGYVDFLSATHGFVAPWERSAHGRRDHEFAFLMTSRWRGSLLDDDLIHFGIEPATLPECTTFPAFSGDRVLGAAYVLEGSTLGGQYMSAHLERTLGLTSELGRSYLIGEGKQTATRWREFLAELDRIATHRNQDEIVGGAADAFTAIADWLAAAPTTTRCSA
jgi:heme oxygenase (biliverdin-IX-beta and delta-forming)